MNALIAIGVIVGVIVVGALLVCCIDWMLYQWRSWK